MKIVESFTNKLYKVCNLIHDIGIEPAFVSPNYVADVARLNGIKLTSDEVVAISDGYDRWLEDNWPGEVVESLNESVTQKLNESIDVNINFTLKELNALLNLISVAEENGLVHEDDKYLLRIIEYLRRYQPKEQLEESLNENIQLLDKVRYEKERGYVIGEIEGKLLVQIQGSTVLVDPKQLTEFNKKPKLTLEPHMKFDEETQKLLFEQFVRCGIYHGNVPLKMNDCYVRYSQWEKAAPEQQIKVLVEGNVTFMPKSQVKILEDLNDFANEENYVPGVLIDEATGEAIEQILVHAIDYTSSMGDADAVKIIKKTLGGEQEMQTAPKAIIRTLAV